MTARQRVRDGGRFLEFDGDLLGEGSSRRGGEPRWTVVRIYRVVGSGRYVVQVVGESVVDGEVERARAQVSETARGVLESLYRYDDDGVHYLSKTARWALEQACDEDDALAEMYDTEVVE